MSVMQGLGRKLFMSICTGAGILLQVSDFHKTDYN